MATGRCLVNTALPDELMMEEFLSLHEGFSAFIKEFDPPEGITIPMIVRYIVYAYDKNSYIAIEYKQKWMTKKRNAATQSKFPSISENGFIRFTEEGENIILGRYAPISKIIVTYLGIQWDSDWMLYCVYKDLYKNVLTELSQFNFSTPAHLAKAKQNGEEIAEDIDKLENRMFSGDEQRELKDLLYETAAKSSLELRPENIATKLEQNEPVVDINPYGEGYKVDKLKFVDDH